MNGDATLAQTSTAARARFEGFRLRGGTRGAVLLIHGFTGSPHEMRGLGDELAGEGFDALGVRLPGHGTPIESEANDWPAWCGAVDAALAELRSDHGAGRIALVGLSMGALLALDAAQRAPESVATVVALSPALQLTAGPRRLFWLGRRIVPARWRVVKLPKGVSDIQDPAARDSHPRCEPFPLSAFLSFDDLRARTRAIVRNVHQPLLIVHARRDRTCTIAGARWLAGEVGSKDVEMHELERSGHVIPVDCERAEVARLVRSFLLRTLS